jgi:hypothetical protein
MTTTDTLLVLVQSAYEGDDTGERVSEEAHDLSQQEEQSTQQLEEKGAEEEQSIQQEEQEELERVEQLVGVRVELTGSGAAVEDEQAERDFSQIRPRTECLQHDELPAKRNRQRPARYRNEDAVLPEGDAMVVPGKEVAVAAAEEELSDNEKEYRVSTKLYMGDWKRRSDQIEAYMKTEEAWVEPVNELELIPRHHKEKGKWVSAYRQTPASKEFKEKDRAEFTRRRQEMRVAAGVDSCLTDVLTEEEYYQMFPPPAKQVYAAGSIPFVEYMRRETAAATYG